MTVKKLLRGLQRLSRPLPSDPRLPPIMAIFNRKNTISDQDNHTDSLAGRVIAVQGVEDPMFFGLLGMLAKDLQDAAGVRPSLLQVRSINGAIGTGLMSFLLRSWPVAALFNAQWRRANIAAVPNIAYRSVEWESPLSWLRRVCAGRALQKRIQQQGNLAELRIDGILVGDLVIDSYLRFRPAATVDFTDPFLGRVLTQMLRDVVLAKKWFASSKPVLYLSSYSTYIEHGVAVRVALAQGVPVRVFGNLSVFGKRLSSKDPYHGTNGAVYRDVAESLVDPEPALEKARKLLESRLGGTIDHTTSYMRQSAYANSGEPVPAEIRGAAVIFLHDFFDSPHIYADLLFDDFWQWVCFTIEVFTEANVPFFLKPHPNQIEASEKVIKQLQDKYPKVRFLSAKITNRQLVDSGMCAGVSVYGTVGHELAYLGVPVICCARHPHSAFDFCRTAKTVLEYKKLLQEPFDLPLSRAVMRHQALQFFYAHNLHGSTENLALRQRFGELFKASGDSSLPPESLAECLQNLRSEPGWIKFVDELVQNMYTGLSELKCRNPNK